MLVPTATPTAPPPTPTSATPQVPSLPEQPANALEAQVEAVYTQAGSAVVNVTSVTYAYDFFFNPVPQEGTGSGFVYDEEGHIVTNYHVIENAEELSVTLADGETYSAQIVGEDPTNDLAVIGIDAEDLPQPIPLADSDALNVGQFVVAIGNPFGLERTLTAGVISSLGRVIRGPEQNFIGEVIQTDAAINPGNSGGPLLDLKGRLIGVNSQIVSPSQANAGVGFAVPANTVRRVVPELIARGRYPHPWLGIEPISLTAERARAFQEAGMEVPVDRGVLVLRVARGGPAEQAGIRGGDRVAQLGRYRVPVGGDIIIAINQEPVDDYQDLTVYLETETRVGDTIDVTFVRDGDAQTVQVTLEERSS
ncbi:MAG: trypsin-like peptidase domain-containing protein [Anaerolineae bacterium]|nr:trypsin-like peptidase domain-containing protein [Anaerolineae bacterium]